MVSRGQLLKDRVQNNGILFGAPVHNTCLSKPQHVLPLFHVRLHPRIPARPPLRPPVCLPGPRCSPCCANSPPRRSSTSPCPSSLALSQMPPFPPRRLRSHQSPPSHSPSKIVFGLLPLQPPTLLLLRPRISNAFRSGKCCVIPKSPGQIISHHLRSSYPHYFSTATRHISTIPTCDRRYSCCRGIPPHSTDPIIYHVQPSTPPLYPFPVCPCGSPAKA